MLGYRELLNTRSEHTATLVKFLLDVNEINYIVENEHLICYNPDRKIRINVDLEAAEEARELVDDLPRRLRSVELT
ncbi:MAG: hypothetical protein V3S04_04045 [Candidatus Omnitrophota bacterium]